MASRFHPYLISSLLLVTCAEDGDQAGDDPTNSSSSTDSSASSTGSNSGVGSAQGSSRPNDGESTGEGGKQQSGFPKTNASGGAADDSGEAAFGSTDGIEGNAAAGDGSGSSENSGGEFSSGNGGAGASGGTKATSGGSDAAGGGTDSSAGATDAGSGGAEIAAGGTDAEDPPNSAPTLADAAVFLDDNCSSINCHGGGKKPRLTNNDALAETLATYTVKQCGNAILVDPGNPKGSSLYMILNGECGGRVMPPACGSPPCYEEQVMGAFYDWISRDNPFE